MFILSNWTIENGWILFSVLDFRIVYFEEKLIYRFLATVRGETLIDWRFDKKYESFIIV